MQAVKNRHSGTRLVDTCFCLAYNHQRYEGSAFLLNDILQKYIDGRDYNKITNDCVDWIRTWFEINGPQSPAVIGISGGKDSSVVAALCCRALGKERVYGILMPNGYQCDIDMSEKLVKELDIPHTTINIKEPFDAMTKLITESGIDMSNQTRINLPPRLRMTTLYAMSQSMNGRVSNNCNKSENYVGYSTIFGDAAGDFSPLGNLTVTEVKIIGRCLGLPEIFIEKPPSDGLTNKRDEDNFGFTYEDLDTYILTGICEDEEIRNKIDKRHRANLFKLKPMPEFEVTI